MRSITLKLIIGFLGIGLVSILMIVLLARQNTRAEFSRFVSGRYEEDLVAALTDYYQAHGSWEGIDEDFVPPQAAPPANHGPEREPPYRLADADGRIVLPGGRYQMGDQIPQSELDAGIKIEVDGQLAGVLIMERVPFGENPLEVEFIKRTNQLLLYSALGATIVALLLGVLLSRTLTRPIRELTLATHALSEGDLAQQVPVRSRDELGELALAFNKMSSELARSLNTRRQMTADIAHELRTPLSLILGHAEAVHDGVLPPTQENFEIIREEAGRLEKLVDDLRTLSLADAGELGLDLQPVDLNKLLTDIKSLYLHQFDRKHLTLDLEPGLTLPVLDLDSARMSQVITNILDNALQFTPEGGRIVIAARQMKDVIEIVVQDNGSGVKPEETERLFDRFYRSDPSRHREAGSGLGLAISKSIVEMHKGKIWAESEPGKGLRIVIQLPNSSSDTAG